MSTLKRNLLVGFSVASAALAQSSFAPRPEQSVPPQSAIPAEASRPVTPEMRGDIHMARKEYREAIDVYRAIRPPTHVVWNKLGIAYHQLIELSTARKHYEQAVKANPKYSEAINNLGTVHYANRGYRRAISYYRKALALNPNSASIHSNLGTAYFARKKYQEAFAAYQKALELDPEVFEHRSSHGVLLQERSVEERAKFHFYLAKTYAKAGVVDRALLYIRKALEEGFKEREKLVEDPEFAALQPLPEFQELLKLQPKVL